MKFQMAEPKKPVRSFRAGDLEAISKVLGHTENGLKGSEIGHLLAQCEMSDPDPMLTKWTRIYNALVVEQNRRGNGGHVVGFVHKAMAPARWIQKEAAFEAMRSSLNVALTFSGLRVTEDGKVRYSRVATTLAEAAERASRLRRNLVSRHVHTEVLKFCQAELLQENYFHAVLEACKSIASKIREQTGLTTDGAELAQQAFGIPKGGSPRMAINALVTEIEFGEQRGFCNLLVGLFGTFRNPAAHAEKIYWLVDEVDALDILSIVSLVHRKLDRAKQVG